MNFPKSVTEKIINYCQEQGYFLESELKRRNIIYVEGMNLDGSLNTDRPNEFNDLRMVFGGFELIDWWEATTEPGARYTHSPMNPKGAARIQFGRYEAWQVGVHGNSQPHEALLQVCPITVCRDLNRDFIRRGDKTDTGLFGVNQHAGYNLPKNNIQLASAGCLVGRTTYGHSQFMAILKEDAVYRQNKRFVFSTIVLPGDRLFN